MRIFKSHGSGQWQPSQIAKLGANAVFESDILIWHPETICIGDNVYIGHRTMLKGHPKGKLTIGNNVWIGQNAFLHSAGSITIEDDVGIGPGVMMLTSSHEILSRSHVILDSPLKFLPIRIGRGSDIGVGSIILPGITIGVGAQIGAGSVVTKDIEPYAIAGGNPAKVIRYRDE